MLICKTFLVPTHPVLSLIKDLNTGTKTELVIIVGTYATREKHNCNLSIAFLFQSFRLTISFRCSFSQCVTDAWVGTYNYFFFLNNLVSEILQEPNLVLIFLI